MWTVDVIAHREQRRAGPSAARRVFCGAPVAEKISPAGESRSFRIAAAWRTLTNH